MLGSMIAAALLTPSLAIHQEPDLMGLSAKEVVAMGYDAWSSKYTTEFGESTGALASGNESFAYALQIVNDQTAREKPGMSEVLARFRPIFTRAADAAIDAQSTAAGGGSFWAVVDSYTAVQREEALKKMIEISADSPGLEVGPWDVWTEIGGVRQSLASAQELSAGERERAAAALNFFAAEFYRAESDLRDMPYPMQTVAYQFHLDVISALKRMAN